MNKIYGFNFIRDYKVDNIRMNLSKDLKVCMKTQSKLINCFFERILVYKALTYKVPVCIEHTVLRIIFPYNRLSKSQVVFRSQDALHLMQLFGFVYTVDVCYYSVCVGVHEGVKKEKK